MARNTTARAGDPGRDDDERANIVARPAPAPEPAVRRAPERQERRGKGQSWPRVELNDFANATRFATDHGSLVKYAGGLGWLHWDGCRFDRNENGELERLARDTVLGMHKEALASSDLELARWAVRSSSRGRLEAMISLARSELQVAMEAAAFDRQTLQFNCASGVIDLRTGACSPHDPARFMTRLAPTFYSEEAACPRWLTFLDRVLGGDLELIEFVQRAVGYSLTGETSEQVLFMPYGSGANGKSTMLEVLRRLFGDYAQAAPPDTFMVRRGGGNIPNDVARLRGIRFATAIESEDGRRLAEALIKQVTGGDTITARFLHREFFEFRPQFKLWLATNHRPVVRGTDHAIWRRIRLIPFDVTIPAGERDPQLVDRLVEEGAGVLRWAVEGCLSWQRQGLAAPPAVAIATEAYREAMDVLGDFLAERCVVSPGLTAATGELYAAFRAWAQANGHPELSSKAFSLQLQERGFSPIRSARARSFRGLGLAASELPMTDRDQ
jgi:putative DNA primase/helicase